MIVRLMGEGQYRIDDSLLERLNEIDDRATAAVEAGDAVELDKALDEARQLFEGEGLIPDLPAPP